MPPPSLGLALMPPPIMAARRWLMARPRPVPPKRRVVELSACSKGRNKRDIWSALMPIPVSRTWKASVSPRRSTSRATLPASVNLTALASRLPNTWASRRGSPSKPAGRLAASFTVKSSHLPWARTAAMATTRSTRAGSSTHDISRLSLPASILEKSSTSSTRFSSMRPASRMAPNSFLPPGSGWLRRPIWAKPRMALRGVRISWLMLARNSLRVWASRSAWWRACSRAASMALRWDTSRPRARS